MSAPALTCPTLKPGQPPMRSGLGCMLTTPRRSRMSAAKLGFGMVDGPASPDGLIALGNAGFLPLDDFAFEPADGLTPFAEELYRPGKFLRRDKFVDCGAPEAGGG